MPDTTTKELGTEIMVGGIRFKSLQKLVIPKSVKVIGLEAFGYRRLALEPFRS